jgi:hexosaminidase
MLMMSSGRFLRRCGLWVLATLLLPGAGVGLAAQSHTLMPVPQSVTIQAGGLPLDVHFDIAFAGYKDARLERAAERVKRRITKETGLPLVRTNGVVALTVKCAKPAGLVQKAIEDESYSLEVTSERAVLTAPGPYGVLRGFETFLQLIEQRPTGYVVRSATIDDRPRFGWRGLMLDVCRHWLPIEVVKRNLDAMAAVKLNVLHWHLSEDQGIRVESKLYPRLQQSGSDGLYYTQEEMKEIVRYAADRGIRVMPEFDIPGHTAAILTAYPSLSSGKGPFELQRTWGVFDPVLDPTNEAVYVFLDRFLGEMAALFPDAYFHIGGDEVNGKQWDASPAVAAFKKSHGMKSNEDLHVYFNKRVTAILKKHGKTLVGWEEILHADLPKSAVVQSWRGQKSLVQAATSGYQTMLSNGYYLDYIWPASQHYAVDPLGKEMVGLSEDAKARVIGGEACMWAEWVTPETVDSRIWPRMAAIAERYWSPATVVDVADMYRRLDVVSQRLTFVGLTHRSGYQPMLERLTENRPTGVVAAILDLVEPVKNYNRGRKEKYTSLSPLNRPVDAARPESDEARAFGEAVDRLLADPVKKAGREGLAASLRHWQAEARAAKGAFDTPLLQPVAPLTQHVAAVSSIGLRALDAFEKGVPFKGTVEDGEAMTNATAPVGEVLLMIAPHVRRLVDAATAIKPRP